MSGTPTNTNTASSAETASPVSPNTTALRASDAHGTVGAPAKTARATWRTWRSNKRMPERKGQLFKVIVGPTQMRSVLIEFKDGTRVVTGRLYIR